MARAPRIAVVAIVKNEAHIIYEWLSHHRAIGVGHFLIYDNGSTDGTRAEIAAFPDQRAITLIDWPMTFGQMPAYENALKRFGARFDWMAFIDADEFLVPVHGEPLAAILADFPDADGLAVPWTLFGAGGHDRRPPGLVIETHTLRAEADYSVNRHTKCIMRPSAVAYLTSSPHIFIPRNGRIVREDLGRISIFSLWAVIQELSKLPGRKTVMYFAEGITLPNGLVQQFQSMISAANRANVAIYAVDAAGLRVESTLAQSRDTVDSIAARRRSQIGSGESKSWRHTASRCAVGTMFMRKNSNPTISARNPGTTAWKSFGLIAWVASSRAPSSDSGQTMGSMPMSCQPETRAARTTAPRKARHSRKPVPSRSRR